MRIERLELAAFGPFTGRVLLFDSNLPGLHVVHGPNEAGKSSALRGLLALLFGFPPRTGDNFLHAYDQLLVGGRLRRDDGLSLSFRRRKKAKNDLFDESDGSLGADALTPFLHGVGQDMFSAMYGIDHETLVRGGQGILDQEGEVGQALFAAGAGFASLRYVLKGLEDEADELFKPRASTRALTAALARHKELQSQLRSASLAGHDWQKHSQALAEAEGEVAALSARREELNRSLHRLERLQRALPFLSRRRMLLEKLQEMGEVFALADDFGLRRRALEEKGRTLRVRLEAVEARRAEIGERLAGLGSDRTVLVHVEDIENLHQRLGAYRKALADRPTLDGLRKGFKIEAAHLLRRIRPDLNVVQAETLRPGLAKRRAVQALAQRHAAVFQGVQQAETRLAELGKELESRRAELVSLGRETDVAALAQAIGTARKAGDLDEDLRQRVADGQRLRGVCLAALDRLGLWTGSLEAVPSLRLPLPETVNEFEAVLQRRDEELRRLRQEEERGVQNLESLEHELRAIEHAAAVPTEAELVDCRVRREEGWSLLRRQWMDGEDIEAESRLYAEEGSLPEAYEQWVAKADLTADRMYREADRVQKHAHLLAGIESVRTALDGLRAAIAAELAEREGILARWRELWAPCGIEPLGTREMRAWCANFDDLRRKVEELDRARAELTWHQTRRAELRELLLLELDALGQAAERTGEELAPALRRAEAVAEALSAGRVRRETLARAVSDLSAAVGKAEVAADVARRQADEWRESWAEAMAFLGLPGGASPEEADDYVDTVQDCLAKLDEEEKLRKRITSIDDDARVFENDVRGVCRLVDPSAADLDVALAVGRLKDVLVRAQQEQTMRARLEEDETRAVREIRSLSEELAVVNEGLAALRAEARADDDEGMAEAERRFAAWSLLRGDADKVEADLAGMAEGGSLEDLESLAREHDADSLPGRLAELHLELKERIEPRLHALAEVIGREKNELARMDGGDAAARVAEEMQEVLATISRLTGRYIRLKVASGVLRAEIERYRAANQGPLLSMASDLFRDLTLSSFAGLQADIDESDRPVILGLRPGGERVRVDGMSSGTRDQLYLSLRLASLSWRARTAEPMPFIVDDILINFDEARSGATLKALADMAGHTQVILFTHQAHVAELARGLGGGERVFVHGL
ncbi:YhaN family protein [Desulfomicrobium escambiense]|uniref:YhaN family protein n=1 Tax=Desulfomicrobium escambiense TaxID=29503 RepID=UPI0003FF10CA|nr:YhaN family protein [Desulfomicrobium escambiense]